MAFSMARSPSEDYSSLVGADVQGMYTEEQRKSALCDKKGIDSTSIAAEAVEKSGVNLNKWINGPDYEVAMTILRMSDDKELRSSELAQKSLKLSLGYSSGYLPLALLIMSVALFFSFVLIVLFNFLRRKDVLEFQTVNTTEGNLVRRKPSELLNFKKLFRYTRETKYTLQKLKNTAIVGIVLIVAMLVMLVCFRSYAGKLEDSYDKVSCSTSSIIDEILEGSVDKGSFIGLANLQRLKDGLASSAGKIDPRDNAVANLVQSFQNLHLDTVSSEIESLLSMLPKKEDGYSYIGIDRKSKVTSQVLQEISSNLIKDPFTRSELAYTASTLTSLQAITRHLASTLQPPITTTLTSDLQTYTARYKSILLTPLLLVNNYIALPTTNIGRLHLFSQRLILFFTVLAVISIVVLTAGVVLVVVGVGKHMRGRSEQMQAKQGVETAERRDTSPDVVKIGKVPKLSTAGEKNEDQTNSDSRVDTDTPNPGAVLQTDEQYNRANAFRGTKPSSLSANQLSDDEPLKNIIKLRKVFCTLAISFVALAATFFTGCLIASTTVVFGSGFCTLSAGLLTDPDFLAKAYPKRHQLEALDFARNCKISDHYGEFQISNPTNFTDLTIATFGLDLIFSEMLKPERVNKQNTLLNTLRSLAQIADSHADLQREDSLNYRNDVAEALSNFNKLLCNGDQAAYKSSCPFSSQQSQLTDSPTATSASKDSFYCIDLSTIPSHNYSNRYENMKPRPSCATEAQKALDDLVFVSRNYQDAVSSLSITLSSLEAQLSSVLSKLSNADMLKKVKAALDSPGLKPLIDYERSNHLNLQSLSACSLSKKSMQTLHSTVCTDMIDRLKPMQWIMWISGIVLLLCSIVAFASYHFVRTVEIRSTVYTQV